MQLGRNQIKRCKYGWMLFNGPYIGKCFELYGQYSEAEVRIMRHFIRAGHTAVDIGANIGDLTVPMSQCAGETGRVYAIESHSDTFHVLCANLALNGIRNTKAINAFIADSDDVDTAGPWGKYGYVSETWQPPFLELDALNLETCAFIKVDVDGKELEVLRSAAKTITRTRPVIYFENDVRDRSPDLLAHLMEHDYCLYWHQAPIFEPDNFYGNPVNHWAPRNIMSLMVLAIPNEKNNGITTNLKKITHQGEWWE